MDEINQLAREILKEHDEFRKISKSAQIESRDRVFSLYASWRDSDEGKQWKAEFLESCGHRCPECDRRLTPYNTTIDHKLPRRKYPWLGWEVSNLWILCNSCNKDKGQKNWSTYVEGVRRTRGEAAYKRVIKYAS